MLLGILAVALAATAPALAGTATSYTSEAAFLSAFGGSSVRETFDEFSDGASINDQISGLFVHSPGEGFTPTTALSTTEARSAPIVLSGGLPSLITDPQVILADFSDGLAGVGLYLTGIAPSASAATVRVYFADEDSEDFPVSDGLLHHRGSADHLRAGATDRRTVAGLRPDRRRRPPPPRLGGPRLLRPELHRLACGCRGSARDQRERE
jgi:hypothetical protein